MMTEKSFYVSGYVKNREGKPVPNLRVEAWDKDLFFVDFLAEVVTDQDGRFTISVPKGRFEELFLDKRPDLFFKVRKGSAVTDEVIADTSDSVLWNVDSGITELEQPIIVDYPIEEEPAPEPQIGHRLIGQLLNEETSEPLRKYKVRAFDLDAGEEPVDLGYDITNGQGFFVVHYTTPAVTEGIEPQERQLRLHVHDREGNEIHEVVLSIEVGQEEVLQVPVPAWALPQPIAHPLDELVATLNLALPEVLLPFLADHGVHTLEDIRKLGGIRDMDGLPVAPDDPAVGLLEAHAVLTVLSPDIEVNAKLIDKGFVSLVKIAQVPRSEFVSALYEDIGDFRAAQLHKKAVAQADYLKNILAWRRAGIASGVISENGEGRSRAAHWDAGTQVHELADYSVVDGYITDLLPNPCMCEDCESAVSPLGYLADLLRYATEAVYQQSGEQEHPISLAYLEETFRQPFGQLTASCDEMSREVPQVRVCIEVLRYLCSQWPLSTDQDSLADREREYRIQAYQMLLTKIGTSYDEVRLIPTLNESELKRLADRLGIDDVYLDQLFLPTDSLTEQNIEALFGLPNTNPPERNPLSDGPTLNDDVGLIAQWNLDGVEWNLNTSVEGQLTVNFSATGIYRIDVYRRTEHGSSELVASGERATADPITLHGENYSGLSGVVKLRYIADQASGIVLQAIPRFTSWRLAYTHDQWRRQDWPSDSYDEENEHRLPVIDPDLMGPDDMRHPEPGEPLFDCWLERRAFVDRQLEELAGMTTSVPVDEQNTIETPNLSAMFERMYLPVHYPSVENPEHTETPWHGDDTGTSPEDFADIAHTLSSGTKAEVEAARVRIWSDLRLTGEAFQRLLELRHKDNAWLVTKTGDAVSDEEWQEVYSILVQAQKERFFTHWYDKEKVIETELAALEEANEGELDYPGACLFGIKYFWTSLTEPEPGDWPVALPEGAPVIDPELIDLEDLPDPGVGRPARTLWENRRAQLVTMCASLRDMSGPQEEPHVHFREVLEASLDDQPGVLDELIEDLQSDLASSDPEVVEQAKQTIAKRFYMSLDDFQEVAEIRAKAQVDSPKPPTDDEWLKLYDILTSAWKRRTKYGEMGDWVREEQIHRLTYWTARKARLPRWRAPAQARLGWRAALLGRSGAPTIDPDLIDTANLRTPFAGDTAFDLWKSRHDWVNSFLDRLAQDRPDDLSSFDFDAWVAGILETSPAELIALLEQFEAGEDTAARLEQLSLTREAFARLMGIRELVQADISSVQDDEWEEVDSILAQVLKRREFAAWRREEQGSEILLCAEHFKLPEPPPFEFPPPEPRELPRWRANWRDQRDWQAKLESRIDQAEAVVASVEEAVSATEEAALPMLRDALVMASGAEGHDLSTKADWISDHLLIDGKAAGCQTTTRIAQAIQTIQTLLFSLRLGHLRDIRPELILEDEDFDEKWKWLGSYASWRAAMFVFLYPENVLLPHLRRWQTPGFRNLVKELGGNRRLTPEQACEALQSYREYLNDVSSLTIEATVIAKTEVHKGECRDNALHGYPHLVYLFARSLWTGKVYVSWYEPVPSDNPAPSEHKDTQSFWEPITVLDNVAKIEGCVVYGSPAGRRLIYLFARAGKGDEGKLLYTTYDLETGGHWSQPTDLEELPEDSSLAYTTIVAKQRNKEDEPPHLAIRLPNGAIYDRRLNIEGTGWEEQNWRLLVGQAKGRTFDSLCAMIEATPDEPTTEEFYLLVRGRYDACIRYRLFGTRDDGLWRPIGDLTYTDDVPSSTCAASSWLGGFPWPNEDIVYIFWMDSLSARCKFQRIRPVTSQLWEDTISSIDKLDGELKNLTGMTLADITLGVDLELDSGDEELDGKSFLKCLRDESFASAGMSITGGGLGSSLYTTLKDFDSKLNESDEFPWSGWKRTEGLIRQTSNMVTTHSDILELLRLGSLTTAIFILYINSVLPIIFYRRQAPSSAWELSQSAVWQDMDRILYPSGFAPKRLNGNVAYQCPTGRSHLKKVLYRTRLERNPNDDSLTEIPLYTHKVAPELTPPVMTEHLSNAELEMLREENASAFQNNTGAPESVLAYLNEAFYFVPMQTALQLQRRRQFTAALDWFRTVFNFTAPPPVDGEDLRLIYYGFRQERSMLQGMDDEAFTRRRKWLLDPLNPHAIAEDRLGTYLQFTLLSLVRCFLDYADAEYTQDTAESRPRARTLYMTALELLGLPELVMAESSCPTVIDEELSDTTDDTSWQGGLWAVQNGLSQLQDPEMVRAATNEVREILVQSNMPIAERFTAAWEVVREAIRQQPWPSDLGSLVLDIPGRLEQMESAFLANDLILEATREAGTLAANDFSSSVSIVIEQQTGQVEISPEEMEMPWLRLAACSVVLSPSALGKSKLAVARQTLNRQTAVDAVVPTGMVALKEFAITQPLTLLKMSQRIQTTHIPDLGGPFCVPLNPIPRALKLHAELNLYKLRNCRNIEGAERESPLYGAPTDMVSGMPSIGEAGQIVLPGLGSPPMTPYRYDYLVERARHLADRAAQMEAAFLSALEKRDAEYYSLMKARQDVQLAKAGVRLQDLRVHEAEDGVTLAELQRTRSQLQADRYSEWLQAGISDLETVSIMLLHMAAGFHFQSAMAGFATGFTAISGALGAMGASLSTEASMLSTLANFERRRQQWELQRDLALQDVLIGGQHIRLAQDRVRIVGQERRIAQMQSDFAEATADFLANKFTNVELYDWMSQTLEGVYAFFLQEATAVAKLAEQQLAFERQESLPGLIQADYWEAPSDDMIAPGPDENAPDRRGLTGSTRLLEDIHRLDQHRFETEERKLQLTKTMSLSRLAPFEFQRFRETGVMNFNTAMELFDRDFPGHYLRLIKSVRLSIIALIPPAAGIRATLSTTGLSRVIVGSMGLFQTVYARRPPESVALSAPSNATGLFELVPQSREMMLPFESMGVDTTWELLMPKASNLFDYRTIADVLMTVEYTALDSYDYRQQIIRELDTRISADRPFSFRQHFPDAWYDLHNPDQTSTPMSVRFTTRTEDFPPNIDDLAIQQVLLYVARKEDADFEIEDLVLYLVEQGSEVAIGGSATTVDGVISTRRANAGAWTAVIGKAPIGTWELRLTDTAEIRRLFEEEAVEDILFVVTYAGNTPPWPE